MTRYRRQNILKLFSEDAGPLTGSYLAQLFGVSRQVIVQDIALLRAQGTDIIATPQGYLYQKKQVTESSTRRIACCHSPKPESAKAELLAIVESGCRVLDVIVEHPLYGEIKGLLLLENRTDVENFVRQYKSQAAQLLSTLTGGVHLHTIDSINPTAFQEVEKKLAALGMILTERE